MSAHSSVKLVVCAGRCTCRSRSIGLLWGSGSSGGLWPVLPLAGAGGPGWWVSFCRATSCGKWVKTGFTRDDAMTLRLDDPAGAKPSAPPSSLGEQGQTAASCAELGSTAPLQLAFGEEASVAHDVQKLTMTQVGGGPVPPRQPNAHLHCSASQLLKPSLKFVPAPRAPAGVARQADAAPHIYGH